jgi:hypothetical protein
LQHSFSPDGPFPSDGDPSFVMFFLFIALILAVIWLVGWQPAKAVTPAAEEKPLRKEIEDIFQQLRDNAAMFSRPEVVPTLNQAQSRVVATLEKRGQLQ